MKPRAEERKREMTRKSEKQMNTDRKRQATGE